MSAAAAPRTPSSADGRIDSAYAWVRVAASLTILTVGFGGLYSIVVALKPVAIDLGATRGEVSFAYAVLFTGFGFGGILMGWWTDRVGIMWPTLVGSIALASGLFLAGYATSLWEIVLAFGVLVGFFGMATMMVPLVANITHWFDRRRGIAVSVVISGSYVAGTVWPPILQLGIDEVGWREDLDPGRDRLPPGHDPPLPRPPPTPPDAGGGGRGPHAPPTRARIHPDHHAVSALLGGARLLHRDGDPAGAHRRARHRPRALRRPRSADALAHLLRRVREPDRSYGWVSDRIGGLRTLVLGSLGQGVTIACFIPVDGLVALYVACALFGLSQGGIVPSYALILRRYFAAGEVGWRLGWVMLFTMLGMAFGGWLAGILFDLTGTYATAFAGAVVVNVLHLLIAGLFLLRSRIPVFA